MHYRRWQRHGTTDLLPSRKPTAVERFWAKVDRNGPIHPIHGQCWNWTGCKNNPFGYGLFSVNDTITYVHRYSYTIHCGAIEGDLFVCHRCDNKVCVNPAHLFLGTLQDNTDDKVKKSRQLKGQEIRQAKLTEDQVAQIRSRCVLGCPNNGASALAREFGVCVQTICFIIAGSTWKHL